MSTDRFLVTGATGYIGGELVSRLLDDGHQVRVLTRSKERLRDSSPWADRVEVAEGDVSDPDALADALDGVDVAYYLVHSMGGGADFQERDRKLATGFAEAAQRAGVGRIVYLGGLHPDGELSTHLASRVEVGQIFLDSPVPALVLQAGVVLGDGSASFDMLRHLAERLPVMVTPRWLRSRIQPIAVDDAVHYLAEAGRLPGDPNRTFDIGGPEVLTYAEMLQGYADVTGVMRPRIVTLPVLSAGLASHWVGLVTPVDSDVARPLVGSLIHDAVMREDDLIQQVPEPPRGRADYRTAVERATADLDPHAWRRALVRNGAIVTAAAVVGGLLTDPRSRWYRSLDKPAWNPPTLAFPIVWTGLYAGTAVAASVTETESDAETARSFGRAFALNMVLNTAWCGLFFRSHRTHLSTLECAALTASSADLARRAAPGGRGRAAMFGAYTAWCGFATALNAAIARRNRP